MSIGRPAQWSMRFKISNYEREKFREMAGAIVVNFCRNYALTPEFSKRALVAITSVLQKTSTEGDAQRTLLLHLTKMKIDVNMASYYFQNADNMKIKSVISEDETKWKNLAEKVIRHENVILRP